MSEEQAEKEVDETAKAIEPKWALLAVVLSLLLVLGFGIFRLQQSTVLKIPNRELSNEEVVAALQMTNSIYLTESAAETFVKLYGSEAVPVLSANLRSKGVSLRIKGNICYILGKYRDANEIPHMMELLTSCLVPEMSARQRTGAIMMIEGLAFTGVPDALAHLESIAGEAYWDALPEELTSDKDLPGVDDAEDAARLKRMIRERTIQSLGRAPEGLGIAPLKRIKGTIPEALEDVRKEALMDARLRRWGLDEVPGL